MFTRNVLGASKTPPKPLRLPTFFVPLQKLYENMKTKLKLLALLLMAFTMTACDDDASGITEETKALRKKYQEQMVGDWTYEYKSDRKMYYNLLTMDGKGNITEIERYASRKEAQIDGVTQLTDWEVLLCDTTYGHWMLEYDGKEKRNVFNVNGGDFSVARHFFGIHDGQLILSAPFIPGGVANYERGKKEPSF